MALEIIRKKDEDLVDYMIRLYENRAALGLSNQEVADLLNKEDGSEYDESRWRKLYQAYKNFFEEWIMKQGSDDKGYNEAILDRYELMRIESKKQEIRFRDLRNEYNRLIANSARFEALRDAIKEAVQSLPPKYDIIKPIEDEEKRELVVLLADWHVGERYYGTFNSYDLEIFHQRIETLLKKIHKHLRKNPVNTVHIASLGDQISGQLRVSSRVSNEIDTIQQIKIASEALAYVISSIANVVENVEVYTVNGNHSRSQSNKEELASEEDSFEKIIPWYLEERLKDYDNITLTDSKDGFIHTQILDNEVVFAHGHLDSKNNATRIGRKLKTHLDYIFLGHTHSQETINDYGTKVIVSPSLMGENSYASQGRFGNQVGQTIVSICVTPEGTDEEIKVLNL